MAILMVRTNGNVYDGIVAVGSSNDNCHWNTIYKYAGSSGMNYFISFVKRHPDDAAGYVQLYGCTNDTTLPTIFGIFKALPSKASPIERLLLSNLYQMEDDPNVAMAVDDSIIADYPNNPIAVRAELSNMLIDLLDNDDVSGARTVLQNIKGQAQLINPIELRDDEAMFALNRNGSTLKTRNEPAMSSMYKVLTVATNLPKTYGLLQNYPNPFNPTTTIDYQLPRDSHVTIRVYDILGQLVATLVNSEESAGYHRAVFNGSRYASGIYFYRMTTPSYSKVQKMLLLK